jgi:hypothetical protein
MSVRIAALSASLLLSLTGATAVSAADLGGAPPGEGRYYPPYAGDRSHDYVQEDEYVEEEGTRDDAYLPPMRGAPRYAEREYDHRDACLPRHEVKDALRDLGWGDFHDFELRGDVAFVEARRRSGELYELRVDACSGRVIHARLLEGRVFGEYTRRHRY